MDSLVKYIDPKNYEKIMNGTKSEISQNYFDILNLFVDKFGEINPDDYVRFTVIKELAANYPKDEIINAMNFVFSLNK